MLKKCRNLTKNIVINDSVRYIKFFLKMIKFILKSLVFKHTSPPVNLLPAKMASI